MSIVPARVSRQFRQFYPFLIRQKIQAFLPINQPYKKSVYSPSDMWKTTSYCVIPPRVEIHFSLRGVLAIGISGYINTLMLRLPINVSSWERTRTDPEAQSSGNLADSPVRHVYNNVRWDHNFYTAPLGPRNGSNSPGSWPSKPGLLKVKGIVTRWPFVRSFGFLYYISSFLELFLYRFISVTMNSSW